MTVVACQRLRNDELIRSSSLIVTSPPPSCRTFTWVVFTNAHQHPLDILNLLLYKSMATHKMIMECVHHQSHHLLASPVHDW